MMKSVATRIAFLLVLLSAGLVSCVKDRQPCFERTYLLHKEDYVPYQGTEQVKFLHNAADTQVFKVIGRETFYVYEGANQETDCSYQYESMLVKFRNQTTNDTFSLAYLRDIINFRSITEANLYTYYKLDYMAKKFQTPVWDSGVDSVLVNTKYYPGVTFIGTDSTSNYVAYRKGDGILRIRINNENWDKIP